MAAKPTVSTQIARARLRVFYHILGNATAAALINFTMWFALTFFVYLQTKSVAVTGMIAGLYAALTAISGIWFGSLVDHHKKKTVMLASSIASLTLYIICFVLYQYAPDGAFAEPTSILLWAFICTLMLGVIVGNIRSISLMTSVTMLIPEDRRDKANGLVGTATGASFMVTSVISGLLVALSGMFHALLFAIIGTLVIIIHVLWLRIPEHGIAHGAEQASIDFKGTLKVVLAIPGLWALIIFTTFNNFLGGIFMALMDAYGLALVSVQTWGFLWGFLSIGIIVGGSIVAKKGLGKNPLHTLLLCNIIAWIICSVFTLHASIVWLTVGMFVWMCLTPAMEAAEQTILQKVVPAERQGRVFGFAQSIEQAASPITAFLIGPLTQLVFIPFMTDGKGAELIGSWFGTGADRGIALVFTLTGIIGLIVTCVALGSRYYRQLSAQYQQS
jgi:MFS transporter, DHA3 family, multidrug efflux protein